MSMEQMAVLTRVGVVAVAAIGLAILWNLPSWADWNDEISTNWLAVLQLAGPTAALGLGGLAAWVSRGRDRFAWQLIAAGSLCYLIGNIAYISAALSGNTAAFPTLPDLAFFLMAVLFAAGIMIYGRRQSLPLLINVYNFILLYGAVIFGVRFLLHHEIKASLLSDFATTVAFLYPALWGSVAALAVVRLVLYPSGSRHLPIALLCVAVAMEAAADLIYASQLMRNAFESGGWAHLLWMTSAVTVAWAAFEHILLARSSTIELDDGKRETPRLVGQAAIPALILFLILITGTISGAFGRGLYQYSAAVLTVILTLTVGLRELWVLRTRRNLHDIAEERLVRLSASEERLTSVLESTSDGVLVLDLDWTIRFYNRKALELVPDLAECSVGGSYWDLLRSDESETFSARLKRVLETGEPWEVEVFSPARQLWFDLRAFPTGNGISLFFRDITEQRRIREENEHLAKHDFLTGLSSRSAFNRKIEEPLGVGASRAVFVIDLDFFKEVNDTKGHAVGDAVLVEVADRVRRSVPEDTHVARLGGDEFAIILEDLRSEELVQLGNRIVAKVSEPIEVKGVSLTMSASVGIASTEGAPAGDDLFTKADIALYDAKSTGRSRAVLFEESMEARIRDRWALLSDLAHAAERGELELVYQPLLDTSSRRTVGFEALLRWRHPSRGIVSPAVFIPLAEESGLIIGIGAWALKAALTEAATWPNELSVAVNIATQQLSHPQFLDTVVATLVETDIDPRRLELEVTESALLSEANIPILDELSHLGIRIALDDFGTGYSSLSYLQRFQFSKLKIDRSFILGVSTNLKSKAIVRTVVDLARTLGMSVTAEGVETAEQFQWIAQNCDQVQGYFIARPMHRSQILLFLASEADNLRQAGLDDGATVRREDKRRA
jgi:diguanylate cyclase (GGDEF)-like protein/PAS domain S-box-containing protein